MKRRILLLLTITGIVITVAAVAAQKQPGYLFLERAAKFQGTNPPVAVLVEMGLKDESPTDWSNRATITGAKVANREGYRFRDDKDKPDKLTDGGWQASSHRGIRLPQGMPAVARQEPIATVGVIFHLT